MALVSGRYRHMNLVLYCSETELARMLRVYNERITRFVYVVHNRDYYDRDIYNDKNELIHRKGDEEIIHIHLLVSFYNACSCSSVKKLFSTEVDKPRVEPITDLFAMYRYLMHLDDKEKAQYTEDELVSNDSAYYQDLLPNGVSTDSDGRANEIVALILKNVNPRIIGRRYGRDAIIHYRNYKDFADSVRLWELENPVRGEPPRLIKEAETQAEAEQIPFEI